MITIGFSVEAAAYLMKIAPDNCIYLSQSVTIQLPFQLLDRLMILKSRSRPTSSKLSMVEFDSMVAFTYSSRALLSIADTDFYEVHRAVKTAYQTAAEVIRCKDKGKGKDQCGDQRGSQTAAVAGANARRNTLLQFIVVEGEVFQSPTLILHQI